MTQASITLEPVTPAQESAFKRLCEAAGRQAGELALKRVAGLGKVGLQTALGRGDEVKNVVVDGALAALVSALPGLADIVPPKFELLVDLGIIEVPADYDHARQMASFAKRHRRKLYYFNDGLTDKNFANPTRILKPGDKLAVRAFKQIVPGTTTSEERMAFLATQGAIHTGAQGASLVYEQKREQLPKGLWYASFDEKDRLWKDTDGYHRVPGVRAFSDGDFEFDLGRFEGDWNAEGALLCFCDVPLGA